MILEPLTIQHVNWPKYIEVYKEYFDSPTRVLDKDGISLDKPEAYLRSLDASFNGYTLNHIHFSFIGAANVKLLHAIYNDTNIKILSKEAEERDNFVFVLTGSLEDWRLALLKLAKHKSKLVSDFCSRSSDFIRMAGYRL